MTAEEDPRLGQEPEFSAKPSYYPHQLTPGRAYTITATCPGFTYVRVKDDEGADRWCYEHWFDWTSINRVAA